MNGQILYEEVTSGKKNYNKQYCSCWTNSKNSDHLLQCLKRKQHYSGLFQTIDRRGKEIDPILHNALWDGLR